MNLFLVSAPWLGGGLWLGVDVSEVGGLGMAWGRRVQGREVGLWDWEAETPVRSPTVPLTAPLSTSNPVSALLWVRRGY